jgi:hypothetical protein
MLLWCGVVEANSRSDLRCGWVGGGEAGRAQRVEEDGGDHPEQNPLCAPRRLR